MRADPSSVRFRVFSVLGFALLGLSGASAEPLPAAASWVPDLGNGEYRNPVLFADYSDPDAIRVGDDFYLVSSSFCHVPGLPILHSRDLVNWTLIAHALPRLAPEDFYSAHRPGQGVWAPALRHHAGKFWLYYPDPDFGIYLVTADKPEGPWSAPVLVKAGKGLIDPCPFWDDDGRLYLVHAWAKSRAGISNRLTVVRLTPDGTKFADEGRVVIDADKIPGWTTLEGPKLYKRDGFYYVFAPAGGVKPGWQAVFRSKSIYGPYEHRIVLDQGNTAINGPHQGAWVDTPSGQDWFLHFQDRGAYGRVVHLQPMRWTDGWPVMGEDLHGAGKGQPVATHAKPDVPAQPIAVPVTTDEFDRPSLNLAWQWQANPRDGWASLSAAPGSLRLRCVQGDSNLFHAPQLLMQRFPAPSFSATTEVRLSPSYAGDCAGLIVFGFDYAWIGVRHASPRDELCFAVHHDAANSDRQEETVVAAVEPGKPVWLRVRVGDGAKCTFSYSLDGAEYTDVPGTFEAVPSRWVGAKVGLFAAAGNQKANSDADAHADFAWFRIGP
ncbi:glycoside hydrolase [Opitutaceae bacterium EW11]|nr:glycoside hydrolase [Opitutaceae bacterium EW11]